MADVELQQKIEKFLLGKPKKSELFTKLVNVFRIPKKSLNMQLYKMENEGRVVKLQETPPIWALPSQNCRSNFITRDKRTMKSNARPKKRTKNTLHEQQCVSSEEKKIIDLLRDRKEPVRPVDIAIGTGHTKASEVNRRLYSMQKRGIILKKTQQPPTWELVDQQIGACGYHSDDDLSVNAESADVISPVPSGITNFQETKLFSSLSDTSTFSQCTDNDDEFSGASVVNTLSAEGSDRELLIHSKTFEDIRNDPNSDTPQGSSGLYYAPHVNDLERSATGSPYDVGKDGDSNSNSENVLHDIKGMDSDIGEINNPSRSFSDTSTVTKPKSFRDFFHVDSQSVDSSNSLDSTGSGDVIKSENDSNNAEAGTVEYMDDSCGQCDSNSQDVTNSSVEMLRSNLSASNFSDETHRSYTVGQTESSPQCFKDVVNWTTPELVDNVLDIEEESISKPITSLSNEVEKTSSDNVIKMEETDNDCDEVINEANNGIDEDRVDFEDMEDCDKVLRILFELKFVAQFILKKKTGMKEDDLCGALKKCASLNLISGSAKLWKITENGLSYASKKFNDSSGAQNSSVLPVVAVKAKQTFKGPPPPPMALLNKLKPAENTNCGQQCAVNDHNISSSNISSQSLFKSPSLSSVQSLNKRTVVPSSGVASVHSGLQPLMSLQFDSAVQYGDKSANQPLFEDREYMSLPSNSSNLGQESLFSRNCSESTGAVQSSHMHSLSNDIESRESSPLSSSNTLKALSSFQAQKYNPYVQSSKKSTEAVQETRLQEIPEKYANYPNMSRSPLTLHGQTQSKLNNRAGSQGASRSVSSKGPPPSPMDILSKSLRKTEISSQNCPQERISVTSQSGSFSTLSQPSSTNKFNANTNSLSGSNFSAGQYSSIGSYNSSTVTIAKQSMTVNQSSLSQSGSLYSNQSKPFEYHSLPVSQSDVRSETGTSQFNSNTENTQSRRGPPAPPAVKLGLQSQQPRSLPTQSYQPVNTTGNANLGLALSSESFAALNKNPVSALMEYAQSRKMQARVEVLSQRGSSHKPTFEMAAFLGNRRFPPVTCHNKKDGRKEACDIALRQLIAEGQFQAERDAAKGDTTGLTAVPSANMTHFDTIAALTHRGFTALVSQITAESFAGRKVIAGLVMKRAPDDTGVLISLGTGNRCITGQQLSLQGNTVNDSHAEIITRRGFLRFLYKQLLEYDSSRSSPLFEKSPSGKLKIRSNITFHLYISTAPCGDGALFSPRDAESSKSPVDTRIRPIHEPTFSSNVQGLLRTKVEGGEGTIPIEPGFRGQTFDGIQRGERLRTMSCTDKICRWNVVGMQGALLSHFLEPVYLDSLTLGLLYEHGHLARAVCCRVGRGSPDINTLLPQNYKLNHPWLGRVTVCDPPREVQKTKALSINWCFGDKAPEVTDGTQGLCYTSIEKGFFSRCSKRNLFMQFKSLCEKFGRQDLLHVSSYHEAKMAAKEFVAAKTTMTQRFKDNGYSTWVSKPVEEEMFGFEES